jgi:enolase
MVNILNSSNNLIGFQVTVIFQLTQHIRDELLIKSLIEFFNCGKIYKYKDAINFKVQNSSDLVEKILPFFEKYPIEGIKAKDFVDFCKIIKLMKNKAHLTTEGLEEIRQIKFGMNKGRIDSKLNSKKNVT